LIEDLEESLYAELLPTSCPHFSTIISSFWWRSFLEINAKGGEILGESIREERLICGLKGVKERHVRFFKIVWFVQGQFKLMLLIRTIYASV